MKYQVCIGLNSKLDLPLGNVERSFPSSEGIIRGSATRVAVIGQITIRYENVASNSEVEGEPTKMVPTRGDVTVESEEERVVGKGVYD